LSEVHLSPTITLERSEPTRQAKMLLKESEFVESGWGGFLGTEVFG